MFPGPAQRKQIDNIGQIFSGFLSTCFLGPNPSNIWMFEKWKQHCWQVFLRAFSGEISAKQTKTAVLCRPISHDQPSQKKKKKLYTYKLYYIILYHIILYYIILYYPNLPTPKLNVVVTLTPCLYWTPLKKSPSSQPPQHQQRQRADQEEDRSGSAPTRFLPHGSSLVQSVEFRHMTFHG